MKIHTDLKSARLACEDYVKELSELQDQCGVFEECEDSCAPVHVSAKYCDEHGNVKTYYFN